MKLVAIFILTLLTVSVSWGFPKDFEDVKFISNYDADTVKVHILWVHPLLGKAISIRLAGVDAPELRSKDMCERAVALEGKLLVQERMTSADKIALKDCSRGKFFRLVCRVEADEMDLSQMLLDRGLAVPYDGGKKKSYDWCSNPFWKM